MKTIRMAAFFILTVFRVHGQEEAAYLKAHAVRFENPEQLPDSVYTLLSPFQIILFGEMHGTNESAPFVRGVANLFTRMGDSVQVGLEIDPDRMTHFRSLRTDSSIYQSDFFHRPANDGRESVAWATLISNLNRNRKVNLFFFDRSSNEGYLHQRDSLMYAKIKATYSQHPTWKMVTLSGNFHNRLSGEATMGWFLKQDKELAGHARIASLTMEYKEGAARANFSNGLQVKALGSYPSVYNSTPGYDRYLILLPEKPGNPYSGFYYTKSITPAKMTSSN